MAGCVPSSKSALPDSGSRRSFGTGAVRDADDDKPKMALVSPFALQRLGMHYTRGAVKYSPRNWELGMPISEYINSLERHLLALKMGDTTEDHAAAIAWNIFSYMHTQELIALGKMPASLDDMPKYLQRSDKELHKYLMDLKGEDNGKD